MELFLAWNHCCDTVRNHSYDHELSNVCRRRVPTIRIKSIYPTLTILPFLLCEIALTRKNPCYWIKYLFLTSTQHFGSFFKISERITKLNNIVASWPLISCYHRELYHIQGRPSNHNDNNNNPAEQCDLHPSTSFTLFNRKIKRTRVDECSHAIICILFGPNLPV